MSIARSPSRPISDEEIATFQRDGVVCLRGLFDRAWVERLREVGAREISEREVSGPYDEVPFVWRRGSGSQAFIYGSHVATVAAQLMAATKINILFDRWQVIGRGHETSITWHRDLAYWPVDGGQLCTIWLALDPVPAENCGYKFVRGSHRWGRRWLPGDGAESIVITRVAHSLPDIEQMRDRLDIVRFDLMPGDCVAYHALTIHAGPTASEGAPRAYVTQWAGEDAVFYPRPGKRAQLEVEAGRPLDARLWPQVLPADEPIEADQTTAHRKRA